jgi:HIRAN domain-containing protein
MTVGNEYYPSAYRRLRNGDAILVEVELEPTNPHDSNAVMVTIDGECAGYLASGPASKYHSVISRANALGYALSCSATVEDVGGLTVRLHLPRPEELGRWLDFPPGSVSSNTSRSRRRGSRRG